MLLPFGCLLVLVLRLLLFGMGDTLVCFDVVVMLASLMVVPLLLLVLLILVWYGC